MDPTSSAGQPTSRRHCWVQTIYERPSSDEELGLVSGEIFNCVYKNYRILELAHWVAHACEPIKKVDIQVDYSNTNTRSYRVSGNKAMERLGFTPKVSVYDSVLEIIEQTKDFKPLDYQHPRYYNIQWLNLLTEVEEVLKNSGAIL